MIRTIHLHGRLGDLFGTEHLLDVDTPAEAVRALCILIDGFQREISEGTYRVSRGSYDKGAHFRQNELHCRLGNCPSLHIAPEPVVAGTEFVWFAVALSVVAVAAVALMPSIPPPTASEREEDRTSAVFDGGVNVSEQGNVVPLVYGRMRTGSVVVSAGFRISDVPYSGFGDLVGNGGGITAGWRGGLDDIDLVLHKGGKGGGGVQRAAQEDPNTLQSQSVARIVEVISEGECVGLADGLKSVYYDETPVQNPDDSYNFKGVAIDVRTGTPTQDYIPGYDQQENIRDVSTLVENSTGPVVQTITDADVNAAIVTLRLNALSRQDTTNGDLLKTEVEAKIEVQSAGGGYVEVVRKMFSGKTTSQYQWAVEIPLPAGGHPWDIRVSRVTPDATSASVSDDVYFDALTEVIYGKFTYPNSAIVATTVDAKQFGSNIPTRTYDWIGLIVEVPSNYNPVTRAYTGVWDGTFVRAWTDNPAWCFRDIVVNDRYGLGRRVPASSVDKWTLYAIAQRCDGLVPDGFGGTHPRHTLNVVINKPMKALEVLSNLAATFRSIMYLSTGAVTLSMDAPEDPSRLVTNSNVVEGEGEPVYEDGIGLDDLYSAFLVSWNDPDDGHKLAIEVVEDPEVRRLIGWKTKPVVAWGETRRGAAARHGRWLVEDQRQSERVTYKASVDHADMSPGRIVSLADQGFAGKRVGGRIVSWSAPNLTLDHPVTLDAGASYELLAMMPDGTVENLPVASAAGVHTSLALTGTFSQTPLPGAVWSVQSNVLAQRQWRVVTKREPSDLTYEILAKQHDPTKYDRVELGLKLEPVAFTRLDVGQILAPAPDTLQTNEFLKTVGATVVPSVLFSWQHPADPRVIAYQAQVKRPGQTDYEPLLDTSGTSVEITSITPGEHVMKVRSIDSIGRKSPWAVHTVTLAGQTTAMPTVTPVVFTDNAAAQTYLQWTRPAETRPITYEILYHATSTVIGDAASLGVILNTQFPIVKAGKYFVRTRFVDTFSTATAVTVAPGDLPTITAAGITGQGALATRNGVTYYQNSAPASPIDGDLWADADDPARGVYRWNGTTWVYVADQTAYNVAASILGQGDLATTNRSTLPFGGNALTNTEFSRETTFPPTGYFAGSGVTPGATVTRSMVLTARRAMKGVATGTTTGSGYFDLAYSGLWGDSATFRRYSLAVSAGEVVGASALVTKNAAATAVFVNVAFVDASGNYITEVGGNSVTSSSDGDPGIPSNYALSTVVATAPANTVHALMWVRCSFGSGVVNPTAWGMSFMLARLQAGQNGVPVYTPGPADRNADVTLNNTAAAITGQGPGATAVASEVLNTNVPVHWMNVDAEFRSIWTSGSFPFVTTANSWSDWANGGARNTRVGGIIGPHAVRFTCSDTLDTGWINFCKGNSGLNDQHDPGWYVLECDVWLVSGALKGGGLYAAGYSAGFVSSLEVLTLDFNVDADTNAIVNNGASPTTGRMYRYKKLVNFSNSGIKNFILYVMANWGGFGASTVKTIEFHRAGIRPATDADMRVRRIRRSGRHVDGFTSSNAIIYNSSTSAVTRSGGALSTSLVSSAARISIASMTDTINGGTVVSRNAGSIDGLAFSTGYYVWAIDPDLVGGTVTYVASTTFSSYVGNADALYLGYITTVTSGGSGGGSPPPSPPEFCISVDAYVSNHRRGREVGVGDVITLLNDTYDGSVEGDIQRYSTAVVPCVRLTSQSGVALTCSTSTPITQPNGSTVKAHQCIGAMIAVEDAAGFRWEAIVRLEDMGRMEVAKIYVGNKTYACGDDPDRLAYAHNPKP